MAGNDWCGNPFSTDSAHHQGIGEDAKWGVPGGCGPDLGDYDPPGAEGSKGRLAAVKRFRTGSTKQGRKWIYEATNDDPMETIVDEAGAAAANGLPHSCRMPAGVEYPDNKGDSVVIVVRPDGVTCDQFFNYRHGPAPTAKRRNEFRLDGSDVPGSDKYDRGSSGSGVRFPGTVLRGKEINSDTPGTIGHALNVAVTRHSRAGAKPEWQVLSKKRVWPSPFMDTTAGGKSENLGDLPQGTLLAIPHKHRKLRDTLGLSNRGLAMWDCLATKGVYLLDGHGQHEDDGAVMQLRIDQHVSAAAVVDLDKQLQLILPYLMPLQNPRPFKNAEPIRHDDGAIYGGGGAPVGPYATNRSNAMGGSGPGPIKPPVEPPEPVEPPTEVEPGHIVTCPACGATYRMTFSELEAAKSG